MSEQTCKCGRMKWYPGVNVGKQRGAWKRYYDDVPTLYGYCDDCGTRLNADGTTTEMVPLVDSELLEDALFLAGEQLAMWCRDPAQIPLNCVEWATYYKTLAADTGSQYRASVIGRARAILAQCETDTKQN